MPVPVPSEYRACSRTKPLFGALYGALILLTFHWAVVLYINSSYLEQFVPGTSVGLLYMVSACITILIFLSATKILRRTGNYRFALTTALIECITLMLMAYTQHPVFAVLLFVVHQAVVPLILFTLDIFMEEMIGTSEGGTGSKRGLLLTLMSATGAFASLSAGYLMGHGVPQFGLAYTASALFLIPFMLLIMRYFRSFKDPEYPQINILSGIRTLWAYADIRNVCFAHFTLQFFFAWMVIYTPLYLANVIGFNWEEIGKIMFVGLLSYVLLEYAIGVIADRWLGEKEMMALGFVVIAVSTSWFMFLDQTLLIPWMIAMFMTRVGASFVETTTESYFFKHTQGKDTDLVSFFRLTRPLSIVIGSILGSITLSFLPTDFELLFVILGLAMIPGLFFTMALKDTK